ncbi:DUF971 family protein [Candidatus Kryptobacter tengchongensis]|uniref:DUF971 family protein n=2 Tax=Kryptobacter tengchongensis TaxID=1643429 RepID=A0A656DD87_KRYT1|nr:DUF971 domain-containing protein [Candidatus Kryptobacter tengchongensis]CUT04833.1 DUF971 family protein [Candidatus Kryptobacter tengchongensis]CUU09272.1 DUF971 family protein [Candidatus Kryptobacter tengchongensis]
MLYPIKIERINDKLKFTWSDGLESILSVKFLRDNCPCATCSAERDEKANIKLPISGQYEIKEINLVGNYAIQITWGDGHNTGIYSFDYLRELKEE